MFREYARLAPLREASGEAGLPKFYGEIHQS